MILEVPSLKALRAPSVVADGHGFAAESSHAGPHAHMDAAGRASTPSNAVVPAPGPSVPVISLACIPAHAYREPWMHYAGEAFVTAALLALAIGTNAWQGPALPFIERDPSLSAPVVDPQTVPSDMLFIICATIPLGVITLGHILFATRVCATLRTDHVSPTSPVSSAAAPLSLSAASRAGLLVFMSAMWQVVALTQAVCLNEFVTNAIKGYVGRHRPNAFALCNYAGYATALRTGNFTEYFANTVAGGVGDMSKCQSGYEQRVEAIRSFMSGHASTGFTCMMFTVLALRLYLRVGRSTQFGFAAAASAAPLAIAAFIAASRVRDRWHFTDDVGLGAIVGIVCAVLAWQHYVAHARSRGCNLTHIPTSVTDDEEGGSERAISGFYLSPAASPAHKSRVVTSHMVTVVPSGATAAPVPKPHDVMGLNVPDGVTSRVLEMPPTERAAEDTLPHPV